MMAIVTLLLEIIGQAVKVAGQGDDPEAERQLLLDAQRRISDEIARREYAK